MAIAKGAGILAMGAYNSMKNRKSNHHHNYDKMQYSTSDSHIDSQSGGMSQLFHLSLLVAFFGFSFLFISNILNGLKTVINGAYQVVSFGSNVSLGPELQIFALLAFGIIILAFILKIMSPQKLPALGTLVFWSIVLSLTTYVIFINLGSRFFDFDIYTFFVQIYPFFVMGLLSILLLILFISQNPQVAMNKIMMLVSIALLLLGAVLFFLSGSNSAIAAQTQIQEEGDKISNAYTSFWINFKCNNMGGNLNGDSDCVNDVQEVNSLRTTTEPFIFTHERDIGATIITEKKKSAQFSFNLNPPSNVNTRLTKYTCQFNKEIVSYQIPQEYSLLTQKVPENGGSLRLECPIYDMFLPLDEDEMSVILRVYFEVDDSIKQDVSYIDCSDSYFSETQIQCENIAREYIQQKITDPELNVLLGSFSNEVRGGNSANVKVKGLSSALPFYLNNDNALTSFQYTILFEEQFGFNIHDVTLKESISPPPYLDVNILAFGKNTYSISDLENELEFPLEIIVLDYDSKKLAGSQAITLPYVISHSIKAEKEFTIIRPEGYEKEESDTQTVIDVIDQIVSEDE